MKNFESGETYIGDGIYASFDGWQIRLRTPRGHDDHEVFLEPGAWATLVEYVAGLNRTDADSVLTPDAEALCACKDRALSACPGEWEPGCDLGANPAFAAPAPIPASEQVDAALGMVMISIRLPAALIERYKALAAADGDAAGWRGTGYQVLMRQVLTDFAASKCLTPNAKLSR